MFISTKACDEVKKLANTQNLVIVAGHSGSGKSAIIQHIALKYRDQGWVVKPVTEVTNIITAHLLNHELKNKTLFVLDDPIGKESFDEIAYNFWKKNEEHLKAFLKKVKLLLSCRNCVLYDKRAKGIFIDKTNIVDIDSEQYKIGRSRKKRNLE